MKSLLFALAFVLTVASCAVWADKPPKELMQVAASNPIVHDQTCNFQEEKDIECLIMYDSIRSIVWLILFDADKDGNLTIYKVAAIHDKREMVLWCRSDKCV